MPVRTQIVETANDAVSANLFTLEIIGAEITNPNFDRVTGMGYEIEQIRRADGGSGLVRKFHGGVIDYQDIAVVRISDNSEGDQILHSFVTDYQITGLKSDGAMIKRHKGSIIRRYEFLGLNAMGKTWPDYDNAAAAAEEMTYPLAVDYIDELY
jgi:hypothetical protein